MKRIIKLLCSAVMICGAFCISAESVYASGTAAEVPEVTSVVSTEKSTLVSAIPSVTEIAEETDATVITSNDINDDEGNTEDTTLPLGNGVLLEDKHDDIVDRQFLTIQTKNGNTFYIIVDKDSTGKEKVYFLNMVDEYDFMAFSDDFPEDEKWEFGVMDKDKAFDVTDKNPKSVESTGEKKDNSDDKQIKSKDNTSNPLLILILLLLPGGGAFYYFKVYRGKKNSNSKKTSYDEDDEYEDEIDEVMVNENMEEK